MEIAEERDGSKQGVEPRGIVTGGDGSTDLHVVTLDADSVDVSRSPDLSTEVMKEVRLQVVGPRPGLQGVRGVLVGQRELEPIDDLTDAGGLLDGPVGQHGFIS